MLGTVLVMKKSVALGIGALAVLVAGCGSSAAVHGSGSADALGRIHAAVGRTEAAGSAQIVSITDTGGGSGGVASGSTAGQTYHMASIGPISFAGPDLAVTRTVTSATGTSPATSAIYLGNTLYLNPSSSPDGWVRTNVHEGYAYLGPVQTSALTTTKGPVTVVGSGVVAGQAATKYLVPIPASTQTVPLTNSKNQPYEDAIHIAAFALSVWLDRAGRIVRTQATQVATSPQSPKGVVETSTTTLSDFGEPVQITAPNLSSGT